MTTDTIIIGTREEIEKYFDFVDDLNDHRWISSLPLNQQLDGFESQSPHIGMIYYIFETKIEEDIPKIMAEIKGKYIHIRKQ